MPSPPPSLPPPRLGVRDLTLQIAGHQVAQGLDFALQPGERLAILGRNGAGKSTLLAALAGLRPVDGGQIEFDGVNLTRLTPRQCALKRGFLGQHQHDAFASTVLETVLIGRHPHLDRWTWEGETDRALAAAALAEVGLAGFETRLLHTLSGGERQRLAIATLLLQSPPLALVDEPLTHLDLNHQIAVLDAFAAHARDQQSSWVMVLHDPGLALRYCNRALLLFGDGRCLHGPSETVLNASRLGELYGHPLLEVASPRGRWFLPA